MSNTTETPTTSKNTRLTNAQLKFLKELDRQEGDIQLASLHSRTRKRTLYRWLEDPVFQTHLEKLYKAFVWHAVFESARLLPKALSNLHIYMCSHKDNVACKAGIDGLRLAIRILDKGFTNEKMQDIIKNFAFPRDNDRSCVKMTDSSRKRSISRDSDRSNVVLRAPKIPKTKLPSPKTRNDDKFKKTSSRTEPVPDLIRDEETIDSEKFQ